MPFLAWPQPFRSLVQTGSIWRETAFITQYNVLYIKWKLIFFWLRCDTVAYQKLAASGGCQPLKMLGINLLYSAFHNIWSGLQDMMVRSKIWKKVSINLPSKMHHFRDTGCWNRKIKFVFCRYLQNGWSHRKELW